ncbi:MAG: tetratricopeptide repeat protein, partial [Shewanella sp.]
MYKFSKGVTIVLFSLALSACSSSPEDNDIAAKTSPDVLYSQARTSMELGNYAKAVRTLEALDSRYPFGP